MTESDSESSSSSTSSSTSESNDGEPQGSGCGAIVKGRSDKVKEQNKKYAPKPGDQSCTEKNKMLPQEMDKPQVAGTTEVPEKDEKPKEKNTEVREKSKKKNQPKDARPESPSSSSSSSSEESSSSSSSSDSESDSKEKIKAKSNKLEEKVKEHVAVKITIVEEPKVEEKVEEHAVTKITIGEEDVTKSTIGEEEVTVSKSNKVAETEKHNVAGSSTVVEIDEVPVKEQSTSVKQVPEKQHSQDDEVKEDTTLEAKKIEEHIETTAKVDESDIEKVAKIAEKIGDDDIVRSDKVVVEKVQIVAVKSGDETAARADETDATKAQIIADKSVDQTTVKADKAVVEKVEKIAKNGAAESEKPSSRSPHPPGEKGTRRARSRSRSGSRVQRNSSRGRRQRSRSRRRSYTRSRSRSKDKLPRRRSRSNERRRRSVSLERRREERKRRHAEREKRETEDGVKVKKSRRDEKSPATAAAAGEDTREIDNATVTDPKAKITERQRRTVDLLTSRTGGAYIPPAKLRLMQAEITDKASAAYQRIAWEALKKSIHGYINKVNVDNIAIITRELLKENIVRGRGLLCRSIIQAQAASPTFTHVYAALVAIINSKFPNIGELLLKRLVIQFKRAFRRNDKAVCLSASRFVAHLVNQRVAHEILALETLTLLVETPTDDSVEVAIAFLKECGMKLTEVSSKGIGAIFEMLKNILHEGKLDKRVQYMIEVVFQVRKDGFKDHQSVIDSLELVEEDDQFTHLLMLDEATDAEDALNAFKFDNEYATNEDKYKGLSKEILGSDASDTGGSASGSEDSGSGDSSNSEGEGENGEAKATAGDIIDNTETNLIALRRTIYLTINSSLDYEECAHKLMKMQLKPGQEIELCHMFLDCCAEQRTYEKFYGLLAQRFCSINKIYIEPFEEIFRDTYQTTHRLDTNRLRNVSKFFAHLLFTDAISWDVLECIKLNEDDTTSSSRIFIKILFQELAEYMGLGKLNGKLKDEVLMESLLGLFPKDNPRNTRFAINFFTSIGLGGLTDELRQFLKSAPKSVPAINIEILANKPVAVDSSSSSTSSSSSSSSTESASDSSSSELTSESSSSSSDTESSDSQEAKKKQRKKKLSKKLSKRDDKSKTSKGKEKETKVRKEKDKRKQKQIKKKKRKNKKESDDESSNSGSESDTESSSTTTDEEQRNKKKKSKVDKRKDQSNRKRKIREDKRESPPAKKEKKKNQNISAERDKYNKNDRADEKDNRRDITRRRDDWDERRESNRGRQRDGHYDRYEDGERGTRDSKRDRKLESSKTRPSHNGSKERG